MTTRFEFQSRDKAAEFDIQSLISDISGKSGIFCLSETTWELAYSLVAFYGKWRSRYYFTHPATQEQLTITDDEFFQIELLIDRAQQELNDVASITDIVTALEGIKGEIAGLAGALAGIQCGCDVGQGADNGAPDPLDEIPGNVGEVEYSQAFGIADRRCKASHWMFDNYLALFQKLEDSGIDQLTGVALAGMVGLIAGFIAGSVTGPFGAVLVAVAGFVIVLATGVLEGGLNFQQIIDLFNANKTAVICAWYTSGNATEARDNAVGVLVTAGLSVANENFLRAAMPNAILNVLFFATNQGTETEIDGWPTTVDCEAECLGAEIAWDFEQSVEGWQFVDISTLGGTANGGHSVQNEALRTRFTTTGAPNSTGQGRWFTQNFQGPSFINIPGEARIVVDLLAPDDGILTGAVVRVQFDSAGSFQLQQDYDDHTQIVFDTGVTGDDIIEIGVDIGRSNGPVGGPAYDARSFVARVYVVSI